MSKRTDRKIEVGHRVGSLTFVSPTHKVSIDGRKRAAWVAVCDCGGKTIVLSGDKTMSCGCSRIKHGHTSSKTGTVVVSRTYKSWLAMVQRCTNPNYSNYEYWGGRGISVCDSWKTFSNFLHDMGERPPRTSIDRIDVNGNYEPGNCRWATISEQRANQRPPTRRGVK